MMEKGVMSVGTASSSESLDTSSSWGIPLATLIDPEGMGGQQDVLGGRCTVLGPELRAGISLVIPHTTIAAGALRSILE